MAISGDDPANVLPKTLLVRNREAVVERLMFLSQYDESFKCVLYLLLLLITLQCLSSKCFLFFEHLHGKFHRLF